MRDFDAEGIAGELCPLVLPKPPPAWVGSLGASFRIGIRAGFWPTAIVFVAYYALNHAAPLPWLKLAMLAAVYGPMVGVLLAVIVQVLVLIFDRVAAAGHGLRFVANPVTAGGLGGVLAGILPGSIGVTVFGSYRGPFVGTVSIAFALIAGSGLIAIPLARRARQARGAPADGRAIRTAALVSTLILCAIAIVIAPVIVNSAFQQVNGYVQEHGATVGAIAGAVGGGVVGVYVGLVIAIGRRIRAAGAPTIPPDRGTSSR